MWSITLWCFLALAYSASAAISQVHLSYPGLDQMLVVWVSSTTKDPSQVRYSTDASSWRFTANGTAISYNYQSYSSGAIHSVLLKQLMPGTVYYYQVGGDPTWSTTFHFKSAPAVGTAGVVIGIMADVGADPDSQKTIQGLINLRQNQGIDIIIHPGDLSYANNYPVGGPVWDHYGVMLQPLAAYTPYNPAVGNHEAEDGFDPFSLRYNIPQLMINSKGSDFYWSFDYGMVHVLVLSSESDYSPSSDQYKWLQGDLAATNRKRTPWVLGMFHRPWYNSNKAHAGEGEEMRKSMEPLFAKYGVDLVLCGHVHAYERVNTVFNNKVVPGATSYITVGNGGTPEGLATEWYAKPNWSIYREAEWGYSRLEVVNATHAYWAMRGDDDGTVQDDHWFVKSSV